jgi:hypothetical protein
MTIDREIIPTFKASNSGGYRSSFRSLWNLLDNNRCYGVLLLAGMLSLILSMPAFLYDYFPYSDAVSHAARFHILANWDIEPILAKNYFVEWQLQTNVGLDIVAAFAQKFIPSPLFLKLLILTINVSLVLGTCVLGRVLYGRWCYLHLVAGLFVYSWPYVWGFLAFMLGVALAIWCLAGWIVLSKHHWSARITFCIVASIMLYFCHLFAAGLYIVSVGAFELRGGFEKLNDDRSAAWQRITVAWVQGIPVAIFYLMSTRPGAGSSSGSGFTRLFTDLQNFGTPQERLAGIASPIMTYRGAADILVAGGIILIAIWLMWKRRVRVSREMDLVLVGLSLLVLCIPSEMLDVELVYPRPAVLLAFVLVASLQLVSVSYRERTILTICVIALLLFRVADMTEFNRRTDKHFQELYASLADIPDGTRLLGAMLNFEAAKEVIWEGRKIEPIQYQHATSLAILSSSAFVPHLFTRPGVQPVRASASNQHADTYDLGPVDIKKLQDLALRAAQSPGQLEYLPHRFAYGWPQTFDYLLIIHFGSSLSLDGLPLVSFKRGSFFDIYRIEHK